MDDIVCQAVKGKGEHHEPEVGGSASELVLNGDGVQSGMLYALTFNLVEFKIVNISYNAAFVF
jgi:hypothetical protein